MADRTPSAILQHYRHIAALSKQMRTLAEASCWDEVVQLGVRYAEAVEDLRALEPMDSADRDARRALLTQILADDARIRALAAPELDRLRHLLGTTRLQRAVLLAYPPPEE